MNIIAIDPGKGGAVAALFTSRAPSRWEVYDCPLIDRVINGRKKTVADPTLMAQLMREIVSGSGGSVHVYIEKVGAMPKQGVTSMFTFGTNYGAWQGIVAALELPVTFVTPQAWKKVMLPGMDRKDKQSGRLRALQLFPYLAPELTLKKHEGRGDALCIGEYGRRLQG